MSVIVQNPPDPFDSNSSLLTSAISLLPRTFTENKNTCEHWKKGDSEAVLQAMRVDISDDVLDQARIVLGNHPELQKSEVPQSMQSTCEDKAVPPIVKKRERRPGLDFKRARFSLKPSTSQTSLGLDLKFDVSNYPDPDDCFAAFDAHERAAKEIKRLRGELSTDSTQQMLPQKTRTRRPGLPGRMPRDRHYDYSIDIADLKETLGSSQKTSEVAIPSSSNSMDLEIMDKGPSQENVVADGGRKDSVAEPKNKVYGILDEILLKDLDGDGISSLLEEQMQIKPVNMEKFDLPLVGTLCKSDANISMEQLGRSMKPSSSVHNISKRVKDKGSVEIQKLSISSTSSPNSLTPTRSPLSSISLAAKHFTLADRPDNTFSFTFGVDDMSPVRDHTHASGVAKGAPSPHIDSHSKPDEGNGNGLSFLDEFESMNKEKNPSDDNRFVDKLVTEDSPHSLEAVGSEIRIDTNPLLNTSDVGLEDKVEDMQQVDTLGTEKNSEINDKVVTENPAYSVGLVDDNSEINDKVVTEHMDCNDPGLEDMTEDMGQETGASDRTELGAMENMQCQGNVSGPSLDKDHAPHVEASILLEQNNETHQKQSRNNAQSKQKAPVQNKEVQNKQKASMHNKRKREVSHRKSLAGAGIQWQGGVRRSTRKRVRPLEFWNGERFIYGRVHESVVSVVCCKLASPAKGKAEPKLKVESFVSGRDKARFNKLF